jgi:hypothetical protein
LVSGSHATGNISTQIRNDAASPEQSMDDLNYYQYISFKTKDESAADFDPNTVLR